MRLVLVGWVALPLVLTLEVPAPTAIRWRPDIRAAVPRDCSTAPAPTTE